MTEKEKKCLEIIEPHIDQIIKFHKSRTLRTTINFRQILADAYFELTDDKISKAKINNGTCRSCATRAFNAIYSLYDRQQKSIASNGEGVRQDASKSLGTQPKKKRGRPRKKK